MPRTCTICKHKQRDAIDTALVAGETYRYVSKQWSISVGALERHKAEHIPALIIRAHDAHAIATADELLDQLGELAEDARRIKGECERLKDFRTALAGIRELVRILELLAELRGKLNRTPQVNVIGSNEWMAIRWLILHALEPYPDAQRAVVKALTDDHAQN